MEIMMTLINNKEFNDTCTQVRKTLINKDPVVSKYNKDMLVDKCFYCYHKKNIINTKNLEVHHLVS